MLTSGICSFSSNHTKLSLRRNTPYKVLFETPQGEPVAFKTTQHLIAQTQFESNEPLTHKQKKLVKQNRHLGVGIGERKEQQLAQKGHLRFNRPTPSTNADQELLDSDSFYLASKGSNWIRALLETSPKALIEQLKLPRSVSQAISLLDQIPAPGQGQAFYPHYKTQLDANKGKLATHVDANALMVAKACSADLHKTTRGLVREVIEETLKAWEKTKGSKTGQVIYTVTTTKNGNKLQRRARLKKVLQPEKGSAREFVGYLKREIEAKLPQRFAKEIEAITKILPGTKA